MIGRAALLAVAILATGAFTTRVTGSEVQVARQSLALLPRDIGPWSAPVDAPLPKESIAVLGVDDYVSRIYVDAAMRRPVSLYVGYYGSQRQGDTIHSPQNCLPGAGWQPVEGGPVRLDAGGRAIEVNRYVIEKGLDRQVVLYWYQGRGRVVANEYANKLWLMLDAARLRRTNGALVRVMAPMARRGAALADADRAAADFTRALFPQLSAYLP